MHTNWNPVGTKGRALCCKHGNPPTCPLCACLNLTEDELITLGAEEGGVIRAIKKVRERTGLGLKEAKEAVEEDALLTGLYTEVMRLSGFRSLNRRENLAVTPPPQDSLEVAFLRKWLRYYENRDRAPKGCMDVSRPDGTDPTSAPALNLAIARAQIILDRRTPAAKKVTELKSLLKPA